MLEQLIQKPEIYWHVCKNRLAYIGERTRDKMEHCDELLRQIPVLEITEQIQSLFMEFWYKKNKHEIMTVEQLYNSLTAQHYGCMLVVEQCDVNSLVYSHCSYVIGYDTWVEKILRGAVA